MLKVSSTGKCPFNQADQCIDRFSSNRALQDADALYRAGAGKWGTDEKTFNAIFTQRSYVQLRAVFEEYQKVRRSSIIRLLGNDLFA